MLFLMMMIVMLYAHYHWQRARRTRACFQCRRTPMMRAYDVLMLRAGGIDNAMMRVDAARLSLRYAPGE